MRPVLDPASTSDGISELRWDYGTTGYDIWIMSNRVLAVAEHAEGGLLDLFKWKN